MRLTNILILMLLFFSCKKDDVDANSIVLIPDEFFERNLIKYDSDKQINGQILYKDIKDIDTLKFINAGECPKTLSGIEHFANLKYLQVYSVVMPTLDLSHNTSLRYVDCSGAYIAVAGGMYRVLKTLNLGDNKVIETLITDYTYLKNFPISQYPTIKKTSCIECL